MSQGNLLSPVAGPQNKNTNRDSGRRPDAETDKDSKERRIKGSQIDEHRCGPRDGH